MKTKAVLSDADVSKILAASKAHANKNNWAVTIAVVDDGGHLLGLQRLDDAPAMSAHIAPAKAHTSALSRRESKVYEDIINNGRTSFLSAPLLQLAILAEPPTAAAAQASCTCWAFSSTFTSATPTCCA